MRPTRDIADFLDLCLFLFLLLTLGFFRRLLFLRRHLRFRSFGGISFSLELGLIDGLWRRFFALRDLRTWHLSRRSHRAQRESPNNDCDKKLAHSGYS